MLAPYAGTLFVEQRAERGAPRSDTDEVTSDSSPSSKASSSAVAARQHSCTWGCYPLSTDVDALIKYTNPRGAPTLHAQSWSRQTTPRPIFPHTSVYCCAPVVAGKLEQRLRSSVLSWPDCHNAGHRLIGQKNDACMLVLQESRAMSSLLLFLAASCSVSALRCCDLLADAKMSLISDDSHRALLASTCIIFLWTVVCKADMHHRQTPEAISQKPRSPLTVLNTMFRLTCAVQASVRVC